MAATNVNSSTQTVFVDVDLFTALGFDGDLSFLDIHIDLQPIRCPETEAIFVHRKGAVV